MRPLLVMGSAPCLEEDLSGVVLDGFDLMAINRAGLRVLAPLTYWATYHPQTMVDEKWIEARGRMGGNADCKVIVHERNRWLPNLEIFGGPGKTGSSTLFGVFYGIAKGYEKIVVAGAPLDEPEYVCFQDGWVYSRKILSAHGRVRSLSGWTKTFLEGLNA